MSGLDSGAVRFSGAQILGAHLRQEDSFDFVAQDGGVLALLADGCGGRPDAQGASQLVVRTIRALAAGSCAPERQSVLGRLAAWAEIAHLAVSQGRVDWDQRRATTLIAAHVTANELNYISIGDSLLFVAQESRLQLLPANTAVGNESLVGLGIQRMRSGIVPLAAGDQVLLATDGLFDLTDTAWLPEFCSYMRPRLQADGPEAIVKAALAWPQRVQRQHKDNLTVLCVSLPRPVERR